MDVEGRRKRPLRAERPFTPGKEDDERGARGLLARVQDQPSAVGLSDPFRNRKAETGPRVSSFKPYESVEDPLPVRFRHSATVVCDEKFDAILRKAHGE